ncbi:MAG: DUF4249 family protein, partial [Ignavibacteriales bacterium]|nr:DUF4249 family protein [Ignavibacteriales bacterium]
MQRIETMNKKYIITIVTAVLGWVFTGCGDPAVDVTSSTHYEPKIVIEAFLYANEPVAKIRITRNYQIGAQVNPNTMSLTPGANNASVTINGTPLLYDAVGQVYYNNSIVIEYGKTYTLHVSAAIDGKQLSAGSVTTVPEAGFRMLNNKNLGALKYLEDSVVVNFMPSNNAGIYVFTTTAMQASVASYIMDNPYETKVDTVELKKNMEDFRVQYDAMINLNGLHNGTFTFTLPFFRT